MKIISVRTSLWNDLRKGALLPLALLLLFTSGCDYLSFYTRKQHWGKIYESQPSMKVLKRLAPEDSLLLDGQVVQAQTRQEPLLFMAVCGQYRKNEIVAMRTLESPAGDYSVLLPPCGYALYIFSDLDQNGYFERDELVGQSPPEAQVIVAADRSRDGAVVEGPAISVDYEHPAKAGFRVRVKVRRTSNIFASLDDDFFDPKYGSAGLYNPAALMAHTQGFLFGLEEAGDAKTAVLFVHGNTGTPRDWKFFVEGLDRTRFQPFFFYYPTGLPLDKLGSVLAQMIESFPRNGKNEQRPIVLVAQSLGGLVAMSAVQKLSAEGNGSSLKLFATISTPYGGDNEALSWLESMPAVVPSWRDVATGSEFLKNLLRQPLPANVPFHLFFTYRDPSTFRLGESSDGIVPLRSQLEPRVQAMATKVQGFNETHSDILKSEAARSAFLRLLDSVTPPSGGGGEGR